jgi:hypothetical protein
MSDDDRPELEIRVDPNAPPGDFLGALARLLRGVRDRERDSRERSTEGDDHGSDRLRPSRDRKPPPPA